MIQCRSIFSLARVARQGKKVLHVYRQSRTLQSLSVHKHLYKAEFPPTTADSENCLCGVRDVWRIHSRSMAGHAHWRNVKHIKEAADSKYALKVTNFINRLRAAIKAGGPNPTTNKELADTLETMKKSGVPKSDIQRFLENLTKKSANCDTHYIEVQGPNSSVFVAEVFTDSIKRIKSETKGALKKLPAVVVERSILKAFFEQKGVVTVPVTKDMDVKNMDHYIEIAIEAGAEDVILTPNEEEESTEYVLKFHCPALKVSQVAREITETHDLEVSDYSVDLIPLMWAYVPSKEDLEMCQKIVDKLQTVQDVVKVFDNISVPDN